MAGSPFFIAAFQISRTASSGHRSNTAPRRGNCIRVLQTSFPVPTGCVHGQTVPAGTVRKILRAYRRSPFDSGRLIMAAPAEARAVLSAEGWLSRQAEAFQEEVYRRAGLVNVAAGDVIFRYGDALGGLYGIVSGALLVTIGPPEEGPRLLHVLGRGRWVGEGCFLVREPRRVGLQAATDAALLHLPLEAMDRMAADDPLMTMRRIVQVLMGNLDILARAYSDLQSLDPDRRIAAALLRLNANPGTPIRVSQADLGVLSGTSRKAVNAALRRFADDGLTTTAYRSVAVKDAARLKRFVRDRE
ncbi:MAG: Crp/Fnr family transcriptional regulator [Rhodovulum sulfidophilum]|uniref:Crp/Fnr family transcriptional regulator n=1 Tax=Rhodovulum sulfidophilum TaxID=35806 RepID=A0A2W5N2M5_RHOSU|nr:MAG: Crp/Fnr family transcriptional regulator [Rhodovulum sulfidophilum]